MRVLSRVGVLYARILYTIYSKVVHKDSRLEKQNRIDNDSGGAADDPLGQLCYVSLSFLILTHSVYTRFDTLLFCNPSKKLCLQ